MIHYTANRGSFGTNELVVVDTGAESAHYAADVTGPSRRRGNSRHAARGLRGVLSAQLKACAAVKPGTTLLQLERDRQEGARAPGFRGKMPHMTESFHRLAAHDVGDYGRRLEPGMVLTVEPGVVPPGGGDRRPIEDTSL